MTLVVVLVVAIGGLLGVAGLRLAQMRAVPLAAARALPASGPGSTALEASTDAWAYAGSPAVQEVIGRYFESINTKNYAEWLTVVTPARAAAQPEDVWRKSYASTTDGSVRISRIDQVGPDTALALVSWISVQRPEDAPDTLKVPRICWRATYPLVGNPPRIDVGQTGSILRGAC